MVMMNDEILDELARAAREAWVKWASVHLVDRMKPQYMVLYDDLSERDKECNRQVAKAVVTKLALMSLNQRFQEDLTMDYRIEEV